MVTAYFFNVLLSLTLASAVRMPILWLHLAVNYLVVVNPAILWFALDVSHPIFEPGNPSYTTAMYFNALYNLALHAAAIIFRGFFRPGRLARQASSFDLIRARGSALQFIAGVSFILMISHLATLQLDKMGAFRMLGSVESSPFLQFFKVISSFGVLSIIFLGELRNTSERPSRTLNFLFSLALFSSLVVAFLSGSRGQVIFLLVYTAIAYRREIRRFWHVVLPAVFFGLPSVLLIFPILAFYRNSGYDLQETLATVRLGLGLISDGVALDVLSTRLNYLEPIGRVVDKVTEYGPMGGSVYANNLVGLIPRMLWPGKPQISNNSQELGHFLGIVTADDTTTSIGLRVIGEAFYELGWLGLVVALFQGLLVAFVHKKCFSQTSAVSMAIYIHITFYLVQRDGYFAVLPGLVWLAIGYLIFFTTLNFFQRARLGGRRHSQSADMER